MERNRKTRRRSTIKDAAVQPGLLLMLSNFDPAAPASHLKGPTRDA
jgi:hypothetical protein